MGWSFTFTCSTYKMINSIVIQPIKEYRIDSFLNEEIKGMFIMYIDTA